MPSDDLPHEVILSIQRVLELDPSEEVDRLDGLSEKFNTVEILNEFFPDGSSVFLMKSLHLFVNAFFENFAC
jgi:hypothetical protein